jgi:hypothetical protein
VTIKRTGTIIAKPSGFFARVYVKPLDGTDERHEGPDDGPKRASGNGKWQNG